MLARIRDNDPTLKRLCYYARHISPDIPYYHGDIRGIPEALKHNTYIQYISLDSITVDEQWFTAFCKACTGMPSLLELHLIAITFPPGDIRGWLEDALVSLMASTSIRLLRMLEVPLKSCKKLWPALARNSSIHTLYMQDSFLTNKDGEGIAKALRTNHVLQEIHLEGSAIGARGFQPILSSIKSGTITSLRHLYVQSCILDAKGEQLLYDGMESVDIADMHATCAPTGKRFPIDARKLGTIKLINGVSRPGIHVNGPILSIDMSTVDPEDLVRIAHEIHDSATVTRERRADIVIESICDDYAWMLPDWISPFTIDGLLYPTIEHYVTSMSMKISKDMERIRLAKDINAIRNMVKGKPIRDGWSDMRHDFLRKGMQAKFSQHPQLMKFLRDTGDVHIEYTKDPELGPMLMSIRDG